MPDIKILVIGSQNVGKSSFVEKFSDEVDKISGTGGLETVRNKRLILGENTYKLMLLDVQGTLIPRSCFQEAHGVIIIYDVNNKKSFDDLTYWIQETTKNCEKNQDIPVKFVIGNVTNGDDKQQVTAEKAMKFLDDIGNETGGEVIDGFFEISVKNKREVDEVSSKLMKTIIQTKRLVKNLDVKKGKYDNYPPPETVKKGCLFATCF